MKQFAAYIPDYTMSEKQLAAFERRVAKVDQPCKYGHFGCSDTDGGLCSSEEAAKTHAAQNAK